jgi:hypothetical protein
MMILTIAGGVLLVLLALIVLVGVFKAGLFVLEVMAEKWDEWRQDQAKQQRQAPAPPPPYPQDDGETLRQRLTRKIKYNNIKYHTRLG